MILQLYYKAERIRNKAERITTRFSSRYNSVTCRNNKHIKLSYF